jgi:hypothetical protein
MNPKRPTTQKINTLIERGIEIPKWLRAEKSIIRYQPTTLA